MLSEMNEVRLSQSTKFDVKVQCHRGCTLKCSYKHLAPMIKYKPDYVILHLGTNDCYSKTSDEVLKEVTDMTEYLRVVLPTSILIISQLTIRTDSTRANVITKNLNYKLKRLNYLIMDNSNINETHLGKKGLHFNLHGTKKMASNIISLIRSL